jgi:hypothetical protein
VADGDRRESGDLASVKWSPAARESDTHGSFTSQRNHGELDGDERTAAEQSSSGGATRVRATAAVALGVRACGEGGAAGQRRRLK